ncbi:MAG: hypothetical protein J6P28_03625 [Treponema sp.]|nr:hypothetical protein [Treponema sp.]
MERMTNYYTAAHWLHNSLILCNNIGEIDQSIYDNFRFDFKDEEGNTREIYQWFLTDASEDDVEYLEKSFGLLFTYSEKLDLYVLCVDHWGTLWESVPCPCYNDDIQDAYLKEKA